MAIMESLSREPDYALRLSRELGLDQQLVSKHLGVLERSGAVTAFPESSPRGPERRVYSINRSLLFNVTVSPHLFDVSVTPIRRAHESSGAIEAIRAHLDKIRLRGGLGYTDFSRLLSMIEGEIRRLDQEKAGLLSLKDALMAELRSVLEAQGRSLDERRVIYQILSRGDRDVHRLSDQLHVNEDVVQRVLESL
jgi:predicted transcriptional regulator